VKFKNEHLRKFKVLEINNRNMDDFLLFLFRNFNRCLWLIKSTSE